MQNFTLGDYAVVDFHEACAAAGIRVRALSSYYHGPVPPEDRNCLVINYSGLHPEQIQLLSDKLSHI